MSAARARTTAEVDSATVSTLANARRMARCLSGTEPPSPGVEEIWGEVFGRNASALNAAQGGAASSRRPRMTMPSSKAPRRASRGAAMSPAKITINGREYDSPDEMPPDVRHLYEARCARRCRRSRTRMATEFPTCSRERAPAGRALFSPAGSPSAARPIGASRRCLRGARDVRAGDGQSGLPGRAREEERVLPLLRHLLAGAALVRRARASQSAASQPLPSMASPIEPAGAQSWVQALLVFLAGRWPRAWRSGSSAPASVANGPAPRAGSENRYDRPCMSDEHLDPDEPTPTSSPFAEALEESERGKRPAEGRRARPPSPRRGTPARQGGRDQRCARLDRRWCAERGGRRSAALPQRGRIAAHRRGRRARAVRDRGRRIAGPGAFGACRSGRRPRDHARSAAGGHAREREGGQAQRRGLEDRPGWRSRVLPGFPDRAGLLRRAVGLRGAHARVPGDRDRGYAPQRGGLAPAVAAA